MKAIAYALFLLCFSVDVYAANVTVSLAWDASAGPDVVGYRVKWGFLQGGPYPNVVEAGMQLTVTISEPWPLGSTVYFTSYAYNSLGIESPPSNEVSWTVPIPTPTPTPTPTPPPPSPTPNPTPAPPQNLRLILDSIVAWFRSLFGA